MKSAIIVLLLSSLFLLSACASALTPPPTQVVPPGTILFQDEFDTNTTGWDRLSNQGGIMDYFEGGYRILVQLPGMNFWSTPEQNFDNVRVDVDAFKLGGPDENRMGVMCRYQSGNYYFFVISNDGYYGVGKFINGQAQLLGQAEMQAHAAIQPDIVNHLRAECVGQNLSFFVNEVQVASVQDADLASGDVGVLAGSFLLAGVDVAFDHFVVTQP